MSKFSLSVFLNAYSDSNASNNPSLNNFKWNRAINGLAVSNAHANSFQLAPGETKTLFSGIRTLAQDGTTVYTITLKPATTNTYVLSAVGGTLPNFRTPRSTGADATTQVTVTQNGPLMTFTSTGGTPLNLAGAVVGDTAVLGSLFNVQNRGAWKVLSLSTTSFTVENELGAAEGPITLGAGFASQVQIFSAAGVQIGDTLKISGGFSPVSRKSFAISAVYAESVEFYSNSVLPQESSIMTQALAIYNAAKQFIYVESDQNVSMTINGAAAGEIEPFAINSSSQPGVFMRKSTMFSMTITNNSTNTANCFTASAE